MGRGRFVPQSFSPGSLAILTRRSNHASDNVQPNNQHNRRSVMRSNIQGRMIAVTVGLVVAFALLAPVARAGSPNFVGQFTAVRNADGSLTISGKEAGLGSEDQVHIVVAATAECINGGGHH